ncbi:MAG: membrane protein insertion efficiency factor YidD [Armatimonadetes bacterium]|nr:membrane protein insertion efficiency factor YidD [Armatimonadota bacterium]
MDAIAKSINGKVKALGNFARSFTHGPSPAVTEPADIVVYPDPSEGEKDWTVLIYADGRNRLAYSTNLAVNKMEHIGSDRNVNIVVQATVEPTLKERFAPGMERVNTRRYYVIRDRDPEKITSPVVGDLGERVPLNSQSLSDFLSWGMKVFPAKHYMVILKKHGLGFAKDDRLVPLSARELNEALKSARERSESRVDVVAFDSCSMAQMEVAYEIKDEAKVVTGSQEDIYAVDYPYDRILWGLEEDAKNMGPADAGRLIVRAHRSGVPSGIQTAVELEKLRDVGNSTRQLVDALIKEVPRNVIYTNMLKSSSMEPAESLRFAFNFRDMASFLENLIQDRRISSEYVKELALKLKKELGSSILDHHIGEGKKRIKDGNGLSLFMPWKNPSGTLKESYGNLKFAEDSSWMKLIDHVFEGKDGIQSHGVEGSDNGAAPHVASGHQERDLPLGSRLGKAVIKQYKEYVSPYLMVSCKHTPSCSQYGREAIEEHGLLEGSKLAFMRLLSCNESAAPRHDPVPAGPGGKPAGSSQDNPPEVLIAIPDIKEKSEVRKMVENNVLRGSVFLGRITGGMVGAILALPLGICLGATVGTRAGTNTINDMNRSMLKKYHQDAVRQFVKIEHALGDPAYKTFQSVRRVSGSEIAARVAGGAVGALTGTLLGASGAVLKGYSWGSRFGGLFAENYAKKSVGELPKHPATESVLNHDYRQVRPV